ncbi:MAG: methyltransferase [Candidatus Dormibacteraeota bacterium]|nr:methyltransferase [Candidatus Dormibacteraeota bacterium]
MTYENRHVAQHYFTTDPEVASRPAPVRVSLRGLELQLQSDRGVFAYAHLDRGTEILLRTVPDPPDGELLDLGCGYGPIAITIALLAPSARVWALDVNRRALELTARNATAVGAANVTAVPPDAVPDDVAFSAIYSNPPVRLGKAQLQALLRYWLSRLQPEGVAYLVVQRHLGADTLAAWLAAEGFGVLRVRSRQGYRVLEVRHGATSDHHGDRDS